MPAPGSMTLIFSLYGVCATFIFMHMLCIVSGRRFCAEDWYALVTQFSCAFNIVQFPMGETVVIQQLLVRLI